MTDIYGIPNRTNKLYIHRVHGILKQLRAWHDELPPELRIKDFGTPRPVASLHLAYNQCIIQTTRPVLLHLFKTQFQLGSAAKTTTTQAQERQKSQPPSRQGFSSITLALAESCVNAAHASSRIVEGLFLDGSIASYGYWDAHHIFSAALILIMSSVMKSATANMEALETLLSILRSMKNDGSIPAVDFCERLSHIRARVSNLKSGSDISEQPVLDHDARGQQEPHRGQHASGQQGHASSGGPAASVRASFQSLANPHGNGASMNYGGVDILGNSLLESFLDESGMPWADGLCSDDGTLDQFASEIEEQFMFQM
ncbi:fungal specific transcription factor domain-containing protein [Candidatus Bathyarchaeota archaeon]|nr:fungal specific transcription factor domain-containing protein [Candidatus Bathyarchaeota archaeon]